MVYFYDTKRLKRKKKYFFDIYNLDIYKILIK
jgi:hypothetical protein